MNADVKEKWLKALRSGKYKQTKGKLKYESDDGTTGYCCLGVLCEVFLEDTKQGHWVGSIIQIGDQEDKGASVFKVGNSGGLSDGGYYPPYAVYGKYAGLRRNTVIRLANINDGWNNFDKVIQWIERRL